MNSLHHPPRVAFPLHPPEADDGSHARTTWFDVDDASEMAERHDVLGSFWGRPALGLWRQAALEELATGTPGREEPFFAFIFLVVCIYV